MRSPRSRMLVLALAVVVITLAHFTTPVRVGFLHNVYQRLYYFPILAGAFWFGIRGGIVVALVCAASYLPHIMMDWGGSPEYRQAQFAELVLFQVVGVVVGALAQSERKQRRGMERASEELQQAYRRLQESFEQLRRADRLSALGQLSAGLAHEIKNPLASMKGSLEILSKDFPPGSEKREFLEIFEKELNRLNRVLAEFLQFARPSRPDRRPSSIEEILESIVVLCAKEADRQGVAIQIGCDERLPEIELDAAQIQQALLNIVLNGIQSMPSGGRLAICVERSSDALEIWIRDEGEGIPLENRSRIFDPFFTTKDRGTGLGMAIAHNLIQGHGGEIHLVEEGGPGSTFRVVLPLGSVTDD